MVVRNPEGRLVVHQVALDEFECTERDLLRVGTHYLDAYMTVLEQEGRHEEADALDRLGVLDELWEREADFAKAKLEVRGSLRLYCTRKVWDMHAGRRAYTYLAVVLAARHLYHAVAPRFLCSTAEAV